MIFSVIVATIANANKNVQKIALVAVKKRKLATAITQNAIAKNKIVIVVKNISLDFSKNLSVIVNNYLELVVNSFVKKEFTFFN